MLTMTIPQRFCGPPNSGNGGYVCGILARHIPGAAEVTLCAPPPLEKPLATIAKDDGTWELHDRGVTVAVGRPLSLDLTRVEKASFDEAAKAEQNPVVKPHGHLLPMCFVCGPQRAPAPIVERLNQEICAILGEPGVRQKLAQQGAEPAPTDVVSFGHLIRTDIAKWAEVIRNAGVQPE